MDTTKRLHLHFSLSCTGEGNGNPLQCSCLENPRDGGAWWAAVYGVAQSRTRLKRLSSSSSSSSARRRVRAGIQVDCGQGEESRCPVTGRRRHLATGGKKKEQMVMSTSKAGQGREVCGKNRT